MTRGQPWHHRLAIVASACLLATLLLPNVRASVIYFPDVDYRDCFCQSVNDVLSFSAFGTTTVRVDEDTGIAKGYLVVFRSFGPDAPATGMYLRLNSASFRHTYNPPSDSNLWFCYMRPSTVSSDGGLTCFQIDDSRSVPYIGGDELGLPDERFGVICNQPRDIHEIFRFYEEIGMDSARCREEVVDGLGLEIPRWARRPKDDGCAGGSGAGLLWPLASLVAMWHMRRRVAAVLPRRDRHVDRGGAKPVEAPTAIGDPARTGGTSSGAIGAASSGRDTYPMQMQPSGRKPSNNLARGMRVDSRGLRRRASVLSLMVLVLWMSPDCGARAESVIGGPALDVRDCFCAILRPSYAFVTLGMLETTRNDDTGTDQLEILAFRSLGPDSPRDGARFPVNSDQLAYPTDSNLYICRRTPVGLTSEAGMTCVGLEGSRFIPYLGTPVIGSGDKTLWDVCKQPREIHQIMDFFDEIGGEHDVCRAEVADALDLELPPALRPPADTGCQGAPQPGLLAALAALWLRRRTRRSPR